MAKTFEVKFYKHKYLVGMQLGRYGNGSLAIRGLDYSEGYPQPFDNITVNLNVELEDSFCAMLNTESIPNILEILVEQGVGTPTGRGVQTDYALFPEFRFNMEALKEFDEDGVEEYEAYSEALKLI